MRVHKITLVFDADSGLRATVADIFKKLTGREDCSLCAITYSPVGKRRAWVDCTSRLGVEVAELHRDEVPADWGLTPADLPCIMGEAAGERPSILVSRDAIAACGVSVAALEQRIESALRA